MNTQVNKCEKGPVDLEDFKKRFLDILNEQSQVWWAEKLNVSQSLLSSSWKTGKLPKVGSILKMLEIKNISANWLFFGMEPKYLHDLDDETQARSQSRNRRTQIKILEKEDENYNLKQRIHCLERALKQQQVLALATPGSLAGQPHNNEKEEIFEENLLPLITFSRLINDLLFKSLESMARESITDEKMKKILNWIVDNFEASKFTAKAALKELEKTLL